MNPFDRRRFLSGLSTLALPLIGGGVTLIGKAALAPIPLTQVAVAPILDDPRQRARYAWEAFSAAMREITADAHGWYVRGGEAAPHAGLRGHSFVAPQALRYETGEDPRCPSLVVDRYTDIDLGSGS